MITHTFFASSFPYITPKQPVVFSTRSSPFQKWKPNTKSKLTEARKADSRDNCFKFTLEKKGEKQYITSHDLNMLKQLYSTIKFEFQLELRYIKWGLFYGIVWNETFEEVVGLVDKDLYVRDILPTWILDLISEDFKLSYLDGPAVANSGVTSPSNKTAEIQQKTPPTLKRLYQS
ncbi:hypothetical protein PIB30_029948 [Stylosanthes scabra]|uniref:Uncharacterized protein n=1 Tax=Stylosanthes scabra TaxID=79078 RepID=A0ABU6WBP0_9FABA|nr:hypothetical protein [Stylosanthes scabra]